MQTNERANTWNEKKKRKRQKRKKKKKKQKIEEDEKSPKQDYVRVLPGIYYACIYESFIIKSKMCVYIYGLNVLYSGMFYIQCMYDTRIDGKIWMR